MVMHGIRANFVPAHATACLVATLLGNGLVLQCPEVLGDPLLQRYPSISAIGVLAPFGGFDADARGSVRQHHARLGLVAVLAAGARVFGEAHLHVFLLDGVRFFLGGVTHNNGHGGRMHAAFALRRRHALPPVPTAFAVQTVKCMFVFRPNFGEESAGLVAYHGPGPTLGKRVLFVELRLDGHQELGIVAAFGSADFNMTGRMCEWSFHDVQVKNVKQQGNSVATADGKNRCCSGTSRMGKGDQKMHGHGRARFAKRSGGSGR